VNGDAVVPVTLAEVSILVLAGGRSRRFGRDKLAEPWRGRTLREHVLEQMSGLSHDVLALVAQDGDASSALGQARIARDRNASPGPLVALDEGLRLARHELVLLVAADMPTLAPAVLRLLVDRALSTGAPVVALESDGRAQPLPVVLRRGAVAEWIAELVAGGERRLRAVLDAAGTVAVSAPEWLGVDPAGDTLRDIDTAEDLTALVGGVAAEPVPQVAPPAPLV